MSSQLKKSVFLLMSAFSLLLISGLSRAEEAATGLVDSPEDVMYNTITLIADGRVGYAATLYMPEEGGLWSNCDRNALIATENVLFAIRNGDLKTVFEQAPYLPGSSVTAAEVAELTARLPGLAPEQKTEILRKCREKYTEAERVFQIVGSMRIIKRFDLTENTVAFILKQTGAEQEDEHTFTALLSARTGKWMINYLMVNDDKE